MSEIIVKISPDTPAELVPVYATEGAAGADLRSAQDGTLMSGEYKMVPTGVKLELPVGFEAQIRPRSGLAAKFGISLVNSPGTIDSDYRGEICVIMINHGKEPFHYKRGDRIAQMVIARHERCVFEAAALSDSLRGEGGFGHTGRK